MGQASQTARQPLREHISELRRRLLWCVLVLVIGSCIGYAINGQLLHILRAPLKSQLYYTSPIGGFNAILSIAILFGVTIAVPVIVYHIIRFISPLLQTHAKYNKVPAFRLLIASVILAIAGVCFGYYVSLPASLHFLTNVGDNSLKPFITISEYLHFTLSYLVAFAILFQLPLILFFINRIKPLRPGGMMRFQRYIILVSFILAALLTPTPDPINQTLMAMPVIVLYQFSVVWIWIYNKSHKTPKPAQPQVPIAQSDLPAQMPLAPSKSLGSTMDIIHLQGAPKPSASPISKSIERPTVIQQIPTAKNPSRGLYMDIIPA